MGEDGRLEAVVDRIVDGARAVLLVGDDETELVVPVALLPEGAGEGAVVTLTLGLDAAAGAARDAGLAERLGALRQERSRPGRFSQGPPQDGDGDAGRGGGR